MSPRMQQRLCFWSAGSLFVVGIALVTSPTTPTQSPTSASSISTDQQKTSNRQSDDSPTIVKSASGQREEKQTEYVAVRTRAATSIDTSTELTTAEVSQAQHREVASLAENVVEQTSFKKTEEQASKLVQLVGVIAPVEDESK
ncbi:hypothetical protein AB1L42_06075 [Thalassoglobus sp. JC818]|uniref:hypothetical protein n=1 Tax=Thalassoglobus sp. JC818 TaxID=3232136 RepID=UPI0034582CB6